MALELIRRHRSFGGTQAVYRHRSRATGTPMEFSIFLPFGEEDGRRPVVYWLSGLTCGWANFTEKAGAQCHAVAHGLVLVCPDTSPRGTDLPGEHDAYDFGSGAGFYVDATREPWSRHYRMYTYVAEELPELIAQNFNVDSERQGIMGHSMGGHGALTIAFKNTDRYRSLSAFAPIVAPSRVPWGVKAFRGYFGGDEAIWASHDACSLVADTEWRRPILVDQGTADEFLTTQLRPELFEEACRSAGVPLTLRRQDGYDHSYYFIATFIADHIAHHAHQLVGSLAEA
jgi:S-formylglutathione hydrolase